MKSHSQLVKEFTEESKGIKVPERPIPMETKSVRFLAKMMFSEIIELLESVYPNEDAVKVAHELIVEDQVEKRTLHGGVLPPTPQTNVEKIEAQMDAIVDCWYYGLDSAAKHGMNLETVFLLVHKANMDKRNPVTGKFERRDDGKVIKPAGWQPADIRSEVEKQLAEGGF